MINRKCCHCGKDLNRMILRVMHKADSSDFQKNAPPDKTEVTLEWLFDDYVDHMIHHLEQIEL